MATLRPARAESVNFDKTENVIIEGDNLEVLKLLQKSYLGKVKMIYIDPPYNTGMILSIRTTIQRVSKRISNTQGSSIQKGGSSARTRMLKVDFTQNG